VLSASATSGRPTEERGGQQSHLGAGPVSNTVNPEQFMSRRNLLLVGALVCTLGLIWSVTTNTRTQVSRARGVEPPVKALPIADLLKPGPLPEMIIGSADAPVTIVEYASMTCPACANFHNTILPKLKEKYIDTGKVRLVFREFPLDDLALLASMAARCTTTDKSPTMISALFARQADWGTAKNLTDLRDKLYPVAQQVGVTKQAFNTCFLTNPKRPTPQQMELINKIKKNAERGQGFGVDKTPTFFVNGTKLDEVKGIEDFDKAIEPLLKG
jgi:protein-disulfide isomerase